MHLDKYFTNFYKKKKQTCCGYPFEAICYARCAEYPQRLYFVEKLGENKTSIFWAKYGLYRALAKTNTFYMNVVT